MSFLLILGPVLVFGVAVWFLFCEGCVLEEAATEVEAEQAVLVEAVVVVVTEVVERESVEVAGEEFVGAVVAAVLVGGVEPRRLVGSRLGRSDSHHCLTLVEEVHALAHALSIDAAMAEVPMVRVVLLSSASFASLRASIKCSRSST